MKETDLPVTIKQFSSELCWLTYKAAPAQPLEAACMLLEATLSWRLLGFE